MQAKLARLIIAVLVTVAFTPCPSDADAPKLRASLLPSHGDPCETRFPIRLLLESGDAPILLDPVVSSNPEVVRPLITVRLEVTRANGERITPGRSVDVDWAPFQPEDAMLMRPWSLWGTYISLPAFGYALQPGLYSVTAEVLLPMRSFLTAHPGLAQKIAGHKRLAEKAVWDSALDVRARTAAVEVLVRACP